VLYVNYLSMLAFAPVLSTLLEPGRWDYILTWNAEALWALAFIGLGVSRRSSES
jgi:hypothetical protein